MSNEIDMIQGMGSNEAADVRRAFDRLQETVEILTGRYREARREQRSLLERLEALQHERSEADTATAARLEAAARDRRRLIELDEQVLALQTRNATSLGRITDAERTISDREILIAEQEDTIHRLRAELEELREARQELAATRARIVDLEGQIVTLEGSLASIYESHSGMEEQLRRGNESLAELARMRTRAEELERELEEARSRSGIEGPELAQIRSELARRTEEHAELEELVAQLKERLASAVVERERQSAAINELRAEIDRATVTVESLRQELQQTESTDEERLRAQRARIDGLTTDLTEALDASAKREKELEEARRQVESVRTELESLRNEYERLVLLGGSAAGGTGLSDDERQEMVTNINNAIELIDKYLVEG